MEFVQFHPTGMIWPPSVRGILVTEGVRGDGGVLLNNKGERFMFNYIPEMFAAETADTPEEARRWLEGDKEARRPPDLLTRDVVARAIRAEVEAGRGSPAAAPFWILPASGMRSSSSGSCRVCTTSSNNWAMWISPNSPWSWDQPATISWVGYASMLTPQSTVPGVVCRRRGSWWPARLQSVGWQLAE